MTVIWLALAGGAAAFAHCLGMCGGFVLHLGQGGPTRSVLARQVLWHAGRITTYVFLGAIAGFLGGRFAATWDYAWLQNALAYVAGGVMIAMGAVTLGLVPTWRRREAGGGAATDTAADTSPTAGISSEVASTSDPADAKTAPRPEPAAGLLASVLIRLVGRPSPAAALAMGMATGLLPCPIVLAFLASAVAGGSVLMGMGTMAALGAGTLWSLLLLGMTGHMLTSHIRRWGMAAAAAVVVLLGVATMMRGTDLYHRLLGCPPAATAASAEAPEDPRPCCSLVAQPES